MMIVGMIQPDPNKTYALSWKCPEHGSHTFRGAFYDCQAMLHILVLHWDVREITFTDIVGGMEDDLESCDRIVEGLQFEGEPMTVAEMIKKAKGGNGH